MQLNEPNEYPPTPGRNEDTLFGGREDGALPRTPGGAAVFHVDVTERQSTEAARAQPMHGNGGERGSKITQGRCRAIVEQAPDATIVADRDERILLVNRQTEELFGYRRKDLLGQSVALLLPERSHIARRHGWHPPHDSAAEPHTRSMGATLQLLGRRRDGSEFPVEVSLSPLDYAGEFSLIRSIRDVSTPQRVEAARATAETTTEELRQMRALTDTALSHLGLEDLLRALLDRILAVMGVDSVAILLLDEDGERLTVRAARGLEEAVTAKLQIPVGRGFVGRIAATRIPLIVDDLSTFEVEHSLLRERLRSVVGVPLLAEDRLVGVVHVGSATPRPFTEHDVRLLQLVADRVAPAIDRAHAYAAEQRLRREAEVARAEAERQADQLDRIFEALADGLLVYDADGRVARTNAAVRRILGMGTVPADYFDRPVRERIPLYVVRDSQGAVLAPEDWPIPRVLRGEVLTGQNALDLQVRTPDGREVDLNIGGAPLHDHAGRLAGAVCVVRDQTERKRLEREREEALRSSEEWFHTMADTAPVLLWVAGTDGLVTFINAPWLRFTGRSLEQELGNGWADGVHPDDDHYCMETYLAAFQARQCFTMEYRLQRFDGEYRWIVDTGVPRFAPDGSFLGYIGSAIDITENKQLERERAEARANELALREVTRHMDQFLAVAAHELRQPLTSVQVGIGLAQRRLQRLAAIGASPPRAGDRLASPYDDVLNPLERAGEAVERLSRQVARLFDVVQAQSGKLELKPVACDLAALVREQVEIQRAATPERTFRLDLHANRSVPVVADSDRLGQVLTNYLTNARKYAPPDRPVEISLVVRKGQARVAVRDEGPGLPPDEQVRVWEPFHRAPSIAMQDAAKESLGLGLYICKTIVEQHGGVVGVDSEVGKGSTFWFSLPLTDPAT